MTDPLSDERIGRNNATFRSANERLGEVAAQQGRAADEVLPFVCECAEPTCTAIIRVSLSDYRHIRSDPRRFVTAVGHETAAMGPVRVVEERDAYAVTEKTGRAAEVAERLAGAPEEVA